MRIAHMVIDLQFGSTGKGSLCAFLSQRHNYDTVVSAWGPNAGHTAIIPRNNMVPVKYIHTMLPIGAINPNTEKVMLGPGSVIDLQALYEETRSVISMSGERAPRWTMIIHPNAMVVRERHKKIEQEYVRVGSTMKGTGAALIEKIARHQELSPLIRDAHDGVHVFKERMGSMGIEVLIDEESYERGIRFSDKMLIEGAQGYSLGIHRGFWPHTTSREVTPAQVLADCGLPVPLHYGLTVYGTMRTFPIRVANRFNDRGEQVGYSGDCYPDQFEMDWEDLGLEPELTTVTKLPRRIFSFSGLQTERAVMACTPHAIFLNFCNYLGERHGDRTKVSALVDRINDICEHHNRPTGVRFLGWGPLLSDIEEF